jgi:hypothetical protein
MLYEEATMAPKISDEVLQSHAPGASGRSIKRLFQDINLRK